MQNNNMMKLMDEINDNIDDLDDEFPDAKIVDLKLKYVIAAALIELNSNLYEISHYGIGTD